MIELFWVKVDVRSPDECWPWIAGTNNLGYGKMGITVAPRHTKLILAHRLAFTLVYGTIPKGEGYQGTVIRHSCDNPLCCNPFHLDSGSQKDNVDDTVRRKRHTIGERNGCAKLTEAQVLKIREAYANGGISQRSLAEEYGVIQQAIQHIVARKGWKHI